MALDDDEVYLKAALGVTLVVFLTLEKRRQARTLIEWALILEVLEDMETAEKKGSRMVIVPAVNVLEKSPHGRSSPRRHGL